MMLYAFFYAYIYNKQKTNKQEFSRIRILHTKEYSSQALYNFFVWTVDKENSSLAKRMLGWSYSS